MSAHLSTFDDGWAFVERWNTKCILGNRRLRSDCSEGLVLVLLAMSSIVRRVVSVQHGRARRMLDAHAVSILSFLPMGMDEYKRGYPRLGIFNL